MADFKFQLGDEVKDRLTPYAGVVVGRHEWLHGCFTYSVGPRVLNKDGEPSKPVAFDEGHLELVASLADQERQRLDAEQKKAEATGGPAREADRPERDPGRREDR